MGDNKKIIVFCDGTWNNENNLNQTNVMRLLQATEPEPDQVMRYVRGVGNHWAEKKLGGYLGIGIDNNIKEGYRFIVANYRPGDSVWIYGFSRGAYTARSLAGFIHNMGILKRQNMPMIDQAYKHYRERKKEEWRPSGAESIKWRKAYTWSGPEDNEEQRYIHFLGVWDTVGALGAPLSGPAGFIINTFFDCKFHGVELSSSVRAAFHALAIDEHRWPYRPTHMVFNAEQKLQTEHFQERWFPGDHCNVGGGGGEKTGLSDLGLKWMAEKSIEHGLKINLDLLSNPKWQPDLHEKPSSSLDFWMKLASLISVKIPSFIGIRWKDAEHALIKNLTWTGKYARPVDSHNLSEAALSKLELDKTYQPSNVAKIPLCPNPPIS